MAKQTFTTGQVLTAAQMTSLQQTAMLGGASSAKIASYVLVAADAGDAITMSNAGATTITVNTGLFAAGDIVTIINLGAGVCTITAGTATVSTSGSLALAQNQGGVLRFTGTSAAIFLQFATPASGDIEGVTAGTGISGGGTSGTVTVTNSMATAIDAKGDLIAGTGADAFSRLGVGANNTILTADSAEATGLKWATPASGGGMTLITTTTWNNTVGTYTYSSLGSYKQIVFIGQNLKHSSSAASSEWNLRLNGSTANSYGQSIIQMNGTTYSGTVNHNQASKMILSVPAGSTLGASGGGANFDGDFMLTLPDYGSAQYKGVFWSGGSCQDGTRCISIGNGHFSDTTAITSVTLFMTSGNFESGTMRVYGVS